MIEIMAEENKRRKNKPKHELHGQRIGHLTVLELSENRHNTSAFQWWARCDCGAVKEYVSSRLAHEQVLSCGCIEYSGNFNNLKGKRFGKLTVKENVEKNNKTIRRVLYWKCICDCGKEVVYDSNRLSDGTATSCGCSFIKKRHGKAYSSEYSTWKHIKDRCLNPNNDHYHNYGGRGIKVCDRWLESFDNFYEDMGEKPTPEHSLDRKDNDGNYELSNCHWATQKIQSMNQRIRVDNKSGVKGVYWDKSRDKWAVEIIHKGKKHHIGRYSSLMDATRARRDAELFHWGKLYNDYSILDNLD